MLNICLSGVEDVDISEHISVEEKISLAIDKFIKITGRELNDSQILDFKNELREVFFEYLDAENINVCDIDSLDSLARVAFYRLVKASKDYFYEKNSNASHENVENLRKKANTFKRDYELIMISS
ncbi:MAG: hypothetical protein PHC34_06350 [Candidatus Gastranaerophilales bacterium]|nr:hypothetical protein [Candidatus Gastranaerophilales bacterium]